jgi:hypothetical protein
MRLLHRRPIALPMQSSDSDFPASARLGDAVRHFLWPISPEIGVVLGAPAVWRPQPQSFDAVRHFLWPISPEIGVIPGCVRGVAPAATLQTLRLAAQKCLTALPLGAPH